MVNLAFEVGITNLWLEGDLNNIIKYINGKSQYSWSIANLIKETCETLAKFNRVHVTHIFREANPVADWFTNKGLGSNQMMTWQSRKIFLMDAKSLIELDKIQGCTENINLQL